MSEGTAQDAIHAMEIARSRTGHDWHVVRRALDWFDDQCNELSGGLQEAVAEVERLKAELEEARTSHAAELKRADVRSIRQLQEEAWVAPREDDE